jgi:hypothetical protein
MFFVELTTIKPDGFELVHGTCCGNYDKLCDYEYLPGRLKIVLDQTMGTGDRFIYEVKTKKGDTNRIVIEKTSE